MRLSIPKTRLWPLRGCSGLEQVPEGAASRVILKRKPESVRKQKGNGNMIEAPRIWTPFSPRCRSWGAADERRCPSLGHGGRPLRCAQGRFSSGLRPILQVQGPRLPLRWEGCGAWTVNSGPPRKRQGKSVVPSNRPRARASRRRGRSVAGF
jgi:hypothetical protein